MTAGAWVLIVAVVSAVGIGVVRAYVDGRFRGTHPIHHVRDGAAGLPIEPPAPASDDISAALGRLLALGERATLVQFSSAFCAPCRATRRVLGDVADVVPGVVHHEIDAEHHLELVRRLGVLRTPTTLVLDNRGVEVARASGAPTRDQVLAQLATVG